MAIAGVLALTSACADRNDVSGDTDGNGGDMGDGDGDVGDGDGDGDVGDGDGDGDVPAYDPIPLRGELPIRRVEFNQGIGVDIGADGQWVGAEGRVAQIVNGKRAIVRAFWGTPPADFVQRPVLARLHVGYADGTEKTFDSYTIVDGKTVEGPVMIDRESSERRLSDSWFWLMEPEDVQPDMQFLVTLWEGEDGHTDIAEVPGANQLPLDGPNFVGVEYDPMETRVVIVPVKYTWNECDTDTGALPQEQKDLMAELLLKNNPINDAKVVWREEGITRTTQIGDPPDVWSALRQIRSADNPDPNVFYYALYDACSEPFGTLGTAPTANIPPTMDVASARYASGKWHQGAIMTGVETFVHEIGHVQSSPHVDCGGAAGTDPGYPHADGDIGVWGLDTSTGQIYRPDTGKDYMSYCSPAWISDYRWRRLYSHQRELTSWDYASTNVERPDPMDYEMVGGVVYADGRETWAATNGLVPDAINMYPNDEIEMEIDGELVTIPAVVTDVTDMPGTRYVQFQLPRDEAYTGAAGSTGLARVGDFTWKHAGELHEVPRGHVEDLRQMLLWQ